MYRAPVDEIAFTLKYVAGLQTAMDAGTFTELTEDLVDAIVGEAGRFASEEVAPLHAIGDEHGAMLKDAAVTMPPGWKELYRRWVDGGWNALSGPAEFARQAIKPSFMLYAVTWPSTPNSPPELPIRTLSFTTSGAEVPVSPLVGSPSATLQTSLPVLASSATSLVSAWCRKILPSP